MAQVDVQWPSEDEDFDAVSPKNNRKKTATKVMIADADKSESATKDDQEKDYDNHQTESTAVDEQSQADQSSEEIVTSDHESVPAVESAPDQDPEPQHETHADPEPVQHDSEPITPIIDPENHDHQPVSPLPDANEAEQAPTHASQLSTTDSAESTAEPIVPAESSNSAKSSTPSTPGKRAITRAILEVIVVVALVGLGLWSWTLYSENHVLKQEVVKLNADPQFLVKKQTDELIAKVGKLIDLPKNEVPTVANVSDAAAARKQSAFFNNAENGDRVLLYAKAGQAVLYRTSTDKIILVAPLTYTANTTPAATSTTPTATKKTTP